MAWSRVQIQQHKKAAQILEKILGEVFELLKQSDANLRIHANDANKQSGIAEKDAQRFILKQFKKYGLKTAPKTPIVAFGPNTSFVHYYPKAGTARVLKPGDLILVDVWGGLDKPGAPFADITWMGYRQNQNVKIKNKNYNAKLKIVKTVFEARDKSLAYLKRELKKGRVPTGAEVDAVAREYIGKALKINGKKTNKLFPHGLGHALALNHPHGKQSPLSPRGKETLQKNLGYTIEPGIYLPGTPRPRATKKTGKIREQLRGRGKFGTRSEINFYINKNNGVVVTTKIQKKIKII